MCGVFGVYPHKEASRIAYLGLYALQHRGEESAGIISRNGGGKAALHKAPGLVSDVFDAAALKRLRGELAVGHVRYSTTGSSNIKNTQPFYVNSKIGDIALAHNGNLTNACELRRKMEEEGSLFQTTMDSEVIAHLLAHAPEKNPAKALAWALGRLEGAWSLVLMLNDILIGARDPRGFRPLCLGRFDGAYVLASETCALDLIGAEYIRDIAPGEIVLIYRDRMESLQPFAVARPAYCIFEYIYFARPDSDIFGHNVYAARKRLGERLAQEYPGDADLVTPIPDSGTYAAIGFSAAAGMPFEMAMIRNHYVGRTFIQPSQLVRDFRVKVKLNPVKEVLQGKSVIAVEDSIVRGTTSKARIKTLRRAGAKKVGLRVSCPPLVSPCFYGIDFPTKKELIAAKHSVEWIRDFIGADELGYLSLEGMLSAMLCPREHFCTACFTGKYPCPPPKRASKTVLEKGLRHA